jgi:hypothetical protein
MAHSPCTPNTGEQSVKAVAPVDRVHRRFTVGERTRTARRSTALPAPGPTIEDPEPERTRVRPRTCACKRALAGRVVSAAGLSAMCWGARR